MHEQNRFNKKIEPPQKKRKKEIKKKKTNPSTEKCYNWTEEFNKDLPKWT